MLGDARNLPLALAVEEQETTLVRANNQNWVCFRPTQVRSLVFGGVEFDFLELSLAHRPDGDQMAGSQDSQGIAILIPCKAVDCGVHVAWELEHWLSLSIHNSDNFILAADCNQVSAVAPGELSSSVAELVWSIFKDLEENECEGGLTCLMLELLLII